MSFTLYADGGARGNPGPAGAGAVVFDALGKRIVDVADYIGVATNNIAEYEAVLRGLHALKELFPEGHFQHVDLTIRMDSKLVIEQLKGNYKVKHPNLVPRYFEVKNVIARHFPHVQFEHVPREKNKDADALANQAMDRGTLGSAMQDSLLLAGIVGFAGGILLATFVPLPWPYLLFMLLLSAGFFFAWFFGKRDLYLFPCVLLLVLVLGMGRTLIAPTAPPDAFLPLLDTNQMLDGTIVADPDVRESNQRVTVDVEKGSAHMRILVVTELYPELRYGEQVRVVGKLEKPHPFDTDEGRSFAYDAFLAKDGIFAVVQRGSVTVTGTSRSLPTRAQASLYDLKHGFEHALEAALPEPEASLAAGLLAGGKQGLGTALIDSFTVTGLLPIIVLSGYNVMIVAEAVLAFLAFLPKRLGVAIAAAAIGLFVLAAGGGASALRAALMAGIALFARATGRSYDALRALLLIFVLMLLLNPLSLVYDPGFQFSFAATLGLILASAAFELRLSYIRMRAVREILATTLAAQLFVLPLLLYQTGNLSFVAIPANVLVLLVVPLAMAASAFAGVGALVLPFLGTYIGLPAYVFLAYIIKVAEIGARLPFAHLVIPAFPFWLVGIAYILIGWLLLALRKTAPATAGAVSAPQKR